MRFWRIVLKFLSCIYLEGTKVIIIIADDSSVYFKVVLLMSREELDEQVVDARKKNQKQCVYMEGSYSSRPQAGVM